MVRFLTRILQFMGAFILSVMGVFAFHYYVVGCQHLGSYSAAIVDKVDRLNSIDEPKIILVGDSNVCFGMDSAKLEEATGMPVVNLGLHGALGNAFHEEMAKSGIKEGDIVIVCHSNYGDDDVILNPPVTWDTIEMHSNLWGILRPKDAFVMAKAYPAYFWQSLIYLSKGAKDNERHEGTCYARSAFNEYGDIVFRGDDRYTFAEGSSPVPLISEKCIKRLNKYNAYVNEKGATLLVAGYPIGAGEFTPEVRLFDEFEEQLRTQLDCEVISHYTDYFMPYDCFYNTNLHLLDNGVQRRTDQLITDILNWKATQ